MFTSYYVTGSLAAFARAYKQRIDAHAQVEIQELAKQWNAIIQPLFPVSWAALTA
jgi:thymidylate synthase (FAD)